MIEPNLHNFSIDEIVEELQVSAKSGFVNLNSIQPKLHANKRYIWMRKAATVLKKQGLYRIVNLGKKLFGNTNKTFDIYQCKDFCRFDGEEFIVNAFKIICKRNPKFEEIEKILALIEIEKYSKKSVLALIRYSNEGKKYETKIKGLGRWHQLFIKKSTK